MHPNIISEKPSPISLVHDLGEALIGDLVVDGSKDCQDEITREDKQELEEASIKRILLREGEFADP